MLKKFILSTLIMTAAAMTFITHDAQAEISAQISLPNVSVSINGYLPAPPGVYIQYDAGRPYYVESERRIYIEKVKPAKHHKKKHHHENNGHNH